MRTLVSIILGDTRHLFLAKACKWGCVGGSAKNETHPFPPDFREKEKEMCRGGASRGALITALSLRTDSD